jgi:ABC-2 type transport system permease protein
MRGRNVFWLGVKELRSLARDPAMLGLIVYAFTLAIYAAATATPDTLNRAALAIVDEDNSALSLRIRSAFQPPQFLPPHLATLAEMDARLDAGTDTFALDIPPGFQRDVLAGRQPSVQLNVDATRVGQAFTGSAYIARIVSDETRAFVARDRPPEPPPVELALRARFNPELDRGWFGAVMEVINNVTMLSIVLTGAALIREREHGAVEHLLAMPVSPVEILTSKVWAMGLVVLSASMFALLVICRGLLGTPLAGSLPLLLAGAALHLFATTSMGVLLATVARSMPQFGLLVILVVLPLQMLCGGVTPRESMPEIVQHLMLAAPNTHFVIMAQAILFRGAGFDVVWPQFAWLALIGGTLFGAALARFRGALAAMA